jgi:hypothetical protein
MLRAGHAARPRLRACAMLTPLSLCSAARASAATASQEQELWSDLRDSEQGAIAATCSGAEQSGRNCSQLRNITDAEKHAK